MISFFFFKFAYKSFHRFEAKASLVAFEDSLIDSLRDELDFRVYNEAEYMKYELYNAQPLIFSFPVEVTKVAFPPYEKNPRKQPIINSRKLEFVILAREYFAICKGSTSFNLLNPILKVVNNKCIESSKIGECAEYY